MLNNLKELKRLKENKVVKLIGNILYVILFIIVILMLVVVVLQRTTDNSVSFGGYRIFTVATGSMMPKYEVSDVLVAKEVPLNEIKLQDDIVYKGKEGSFKDKVVTHQVIAFSEENGTYKFITKGIANIEQDPEITGDQVYGKIVYKVKSLSFIGKMISNIYIFYFIIFIPIALIIYKQIRVIASGRDEEDEDEENEDEGKEKKDKGDE